MRENVFQLSIAELHAALKKGEFTCVELAQAHLDRSEETEKNFHAFLSILPELALQQAKTADRMFKENKATILTGIPYAVKDNYCVRGTVTTAGSKMLEHYVAPHTATAVEKLERAGAVLIGKTNMDEFAIGSSTEYSAYGPAKNPWDPSKVPGGSSGGSAVAVATGAAVFALGSDTGGSIRLPAAFCGVVGVKPTYGRISRNGLIAMASSLDVVGPFARNISDAALVTRLLAGPDSKDATASEESVGKEWDLGKGTLKGMTVGIPGEYFELEGMAPEVQAAMEVLLEKIRHSGAKIVEVHLPLTTMGLAAYYVIVPSEISSNLARYDGLTYGSGTKKKSPSLKEFVDATRSEGFGPEVKRRIMLGTFALSAGYHDAYYGRAQKVRTLIRQEFDSAFKQADVLIAPTAPMLPFGLGEKSDPLAMYLTDLFTIPTNLAGNCAVNIPVAWTKGKQRLPIGAQIIAPHWGEAAMFGAAQAVEKLVAFERP